MSSARAGFPMNVTGTDIVPEPGRGAPHPRGGLTSLADVRRIPLSQHRAAEGLLTVAQDHERCFVVKPAQAGTIRGHHAHRALSQFLVCLAGEIDVEVDDARDRQVHRLDELSHGLLVPPGIWCVQTYRTADAVLMVLCNQPFAEADYIRDYDTFVRDVRRREALLARAPVRLNLGCGGRPLAGYVNVDMDSLEQIRARYPGRTYDDELVVVNYDIFNLPFEDGSVDEVRSEALIEHLPFVDEPRFFREVVRVLKPGGLLYLTTVDFEKAAQQWLAAADDWQDFYRNDEEAIRTQHWFGTHSYRADNRWGYLTATFYGSQHGAGQFHTNCYSEAKLRAICRRMNLEVEAVERFQWHGDRDHMLALTARKPRQA
jgi:SAM-dependent methyltransferase